MSDFDLTADEHGEYLAGQLLVAMPGMKDPRFQKTVIYMCAHNSDGAMGLVVNRVFDSLSFPDMLEQLGIDSGDSSAIIKIHFGGPVESGRGFVLHSSDGRMLQRIIQDDMNALRKAAGSTVAAIRDTVETA